MRYYCLQVMLPCHKDFLCCIYDVLMESAHTNTTKDHKEESICTKTLSKPHIHEIFFNFNI